MLSSLIDRHTHSTAMKGQIMITQSELKELLDYNPETGIFTWKKRTSNRIKVGSIAGSFHMCGYVEIKVGGTRCLAHRLAWLYVYGYMPKLIDHINRNKQDNKIKNLREADYSQNALNSKIRSDNSSGAKCVYFDKRNNSWEVKIKKEYIGKYKTLEEATQKANEKRKEFAGEFFN
jgi:hypothetical protein